MLRRGLEAPRRCGRRRTSSRAARLAQGGIWTLTARSAGPAAPSGAGGLARRPAGCRPGGFHEVLMDGGHARPPRQGSIGRGCGCAVLRLHVPRPTKAACAPQAAVTVRHCFSVDRPGCRFRRHRRPRPPRTRRCSPVLRACGTRRWSWQARLQLDEPTGRVVHLAHGQAEPVPKKPEPLATGPGDELFGGLRRLFGAMGVVHGRSVPFGRCRPGSGR